MHCTHTREVELKIQDQYDTGPKPKIAAKQNRDDMVNKKDKISVMIITWRYVQVCQFYKVL